MATVVQALAVFATAHHVDPRAHGHGIQVPTLFMGHAPVHPQAFTAQVHRFALLVAQQRARAFEAALQVVVPHENPSAVHIACCCFTHEQVRADHQLLAGRLQLCRGQRAAARTGGEELRPLTGNQVGCRLLVAFAHLLRKRIEGAQTQPTGTERVERQLRLHGLLQKAGGGGVTLQFVRDRFHRGCQKQRRGNRVENAVEAQGVRVAFHGGSPLFLWCSPRDLACCHELYGKNSGRPKPARQLSQTRTKARARGPAQVFYSLVLFS